MNSPAHPSVPAIIAIELLALDAPKSKHGQSLRILVDASAARMMISGMTAARSGSSSYSNGAIAHWMAVIVSSYYQGPGADAAWSTAAVLSDQDAFASAYAIRGAFSTPEETAKALRQAAAKLEERLGGRCLSEQGDSHIGAKAPTLSDWTDAHAKTLLGRVAASEEFLNTYMIFTDQRALLKSVRNDMAMELAMEGGAKAALAQELDD